MLQWRMENGDGIRFLKKLNLITRDLFIINLCEISKDQAAEIELTKKDIFCLSLTWSKDIFQLPEPVHNDEIEVFEALHPPTNIKYGRLNCYPGEYLPSWCHGSYDPTIFSSLTEIMVIGCPKLSSLEQFLQPAYMPAIKIMMIKECTSLESIPVERFGGLPSLEELKVTNCPKINSQCLLAPSLKKLSLEDPGNLENDIDCRSLTTINLSNYHLASLTFNREKLPLLTELTIGECRELETLNGGWPILKSLSIMLCPRLKWENGIVLPSSLQSLHLWDRGYFSVRCLENLTSLNSLVMTVCKHIEYIPRDLWSSNLKSLQKLTIKHCEDVVSIGGQEVIAHIPKVDIQNCPNLKEVQQPLLRGYPFRFRFFSCNKL
ncbi:unnamed protein product [Miscanthus lutarioriparius]|uniref:R13L1/DRL21-like LRR repeat region domain-containing protein n=1 Tax=Miscanthus lutarioriparius TaxID=422564 RepID=A0A811PYF9_9POAL|nr:unnamed protein product [Miscanthus lutarioriparius]